MSVEKKELAHVNRFLFLFDWQSILKVFLRGDNANICKENVEWSSGKSSEMLPMRMGPYLLNKEYWTGKETTMDALSPPLWPCSNILSTQIEKNYGYLDWGFISEPITVYYVSIWILIWDLESRSMTCNLDRGRAGLDGGPLSAIRVWVRIHYGTEPNPMHYDHCTWDWLSISKACRPWSLQDGMHTWTSSYSRWYFLYPFSDGDAVSFSCKLNKAFTQVTTMVTRRVDAVLGI